MLYLMPNDLIGSTQAARILDIDKATLSRWVAAGDLRPAHKLPGRNGAMLFHLDDIQRLAAQRQATS